MKLNISLLACLLAGATAACSYLPAVGPNYQRVEMDLPSTYNEANILQQTSSTMPYWQRLNDLTLNELETMAQRQNLTMQQAWQRVKQARAAANMSLGNLGPQVQAQGGYQGQRIGAQANLINGTTQTLDIFSAGVGAQWEVDLFGGNRRALQAARANAEAAQAQADGVRSAMLAEVARRYVTYRSLQQQEDLLQRQVSATQTLASLVGHQARVGLVDGMALSQVQARHQQLLLQLPALHALKAGTQYGLESLLGQKPGTLTQLLESTSSTLPPVPASTSLVLPSQLILLRPDVRAHEGAAKAATASVGVAMSDLFPKFSLTGSYGVQAPTPGGLAKSTALVWSGGPEFRWTLFSMGQVWQNIKLQESKQKEAVLAYQQTALDALADVEGRLAAYNAGQQSLAAAQTLAQNTTQTANLARQQHQKGLISGLDLQQNLVAGWQGQSALSQAHLQALLSYINLHQAFGL